MMAKALDLTGQVFGRLTVIEATSERQKGCVVWKCACSGGVDKPHAVVYTQVRTDILRSGNTKSCGCLLRESIGERSRKYAFPVPLSSLKSLYEDGLSLGKITARLRQMPGLESLSPRTVNYHLKKEGTVMRDMSVAGRVRVKSLSLAQRLALTEKATSKLLSLREAGLKNPGYVRTAAMRKRASRTTSRWRAVLRANQQAEREQSEAIERALNGEAFR